MYTKLMKLIHTADLHLGRQFYGFNILPDQEHILNQIVEIATNEDADGILIAGDIYDTPVASRAAVDLLDRFLTKLSEKNIAVFMVSGNHDSPERIHYGSSLMDKSGIYISGIYDLERDVRIVSVTDEYGPVHICLLPYLDPATVRSSGKCDGTITTFDDAVRSVMNTISVNTDERCILLAHQFFIGQGSPPKSSESERLIVGGIEQVSSDCLTDFDYVALGHLHTPQKVGHGMVRYAGSPLKYSPSESSLTKSVTIVELLQKGNVIIREKELTPLRDLKIFIGTFADLMKPKAASNDFAVMQITDEILPQDAMQHLRTIYPNIIRIEFLHEFTTDGFIGARMEDLQNKTDLELFSEFFSETSGREMTEFQERIVSDILLKMAGEKI